MASRAAFRTAIRATALFVVPTLVLCVGALELGLRCLGRQPSNTTDGIFEAAGNTYRLRPNMTKLSRTPSFSCVIETNSFGFRDRVAGPRQLGPEPYFAFVGDSLTFGNGVDYDQSYVGVFAALARARGFGTINLAVGGHRLTDQEEVLDDFLARAPQRPSEVVVVFTAPLLAMFELRHTDLIVKNGYLFHRGNWVVPYLTVLLGDGSSAYTFFRNGLRKAQAKFWPSGPSAALELMEIYALDYPSGQAKALARLEERLARLDERIRAAGARPVYVFLPNSADLRRDELLAAAGKEVQAYDFERYHSALVRHCERANSLLVDLSALMEREQAKGIPLSFAQDMHYTAAASKVIGTAIFDQVLGGAAGDARAP